MLKNSHILKRVVPQKLTRTKPKGLSLAESMVSLLIMSVVVTATIPIMTKISETKTGVDLHALKCVTGSNFAFYTNSDGSTSKPDKTTNSECYYAFTNAKYGTGNAMNTIKWRAEHGTTTEQTAAKKMLRAACDDGGEKACDYFVDKCVKDGSTNTPYCDDTSSFLDITYYLTQPTSTLNTGATYIANKVKGMLPHMNERLLAEVQNDATGTNLAGSIDGAWIYISGCNLGYESACQEAYDQGYNHSCTDVKANWDDAPTGIYRLTSTGDPSSNTPQSATCNMTSYATAAITGCNADPYVEEDCQIGYDNQYNRTCSQVFDNWEPMADTFNLTANGADPPNPGETECDGNATCIAQGAGATCADGTLYAGTWDGSYLFATPGHVGSASWNNGKYRYSTSGATNSNDGRANVTILDAATPATLLSGDESAPYPMAVACNNLNAYGHSDWYLPAKNELALMCDNRNQGDLADTFTTAGYYSSTENSSIANWSANFSNGSIGAGSYKHYSSRYRCIRSEATGGEPPACVSAAGTTCADDSIYVGEYDSRYIFAMPFDQGTSKWNGGINVSHSTGNQDPKNGQVNTNMIVAISAPVYSAGDIAAPYKAVAVCEALNDANSGTGTSYDGGTTYYNDWYLPSKNELARIYYLAVSSPIGDFANNYIHCGHYWSSSESSNSTAYAGYSWGCSGSSGATARTKRESKNVWCVRRSF